MDVILPVAGLGSRLRPQTWTKPKPLVSLAGKPILEHVIDRVMPLEPSRLVFITGFLGDQVEAWVRQRYPDMDVAFVHQPVMRGQTDAIVRARDIVTGEALILFPDMLFETDWSVLQGTTADAVMFTKQVEDPSALGVAVLDGDGYITKLVEKPQQFVSDLAVIGIYWVREMPRLFSAIDDQIAQNIALKGEYFIADAIQLMIDDGAKVTTAPVTAWEDAGNVPNLLASNRWALDRMELPAVERDGVAVIMPSIVAASATVERSVVGPYACIGEDAVVRDSIIRDTIVEEKARIDHAILDNTLIGRRANVSGRAIGLNVGDDSAVSL
jgi:glucose-1-phosphate thymidylyltransferase